MQRQTQSNLLENVLEAYCYAANPFIYEIRARLYVTQRSNFTLYRKNILKLAFFY